ncbi:MAG TPA: cellulose biosynthesis protein BcsQ [Alcanivorax sp.]|nr:cellulose biosynthesis protein BcsQ [Alcanivorax sp.]
MLIAVASPKGGVGKTTCAAHLAYGIAAAGYRTIAVDFDPQNSLRLHFGIPLGELSGLARAGTRGGDWLPRVLDGGGGVGVLPYGAADGAQRRALDHALRTPGFVASGLRGLAEPPGTVVVVDLPPGPSPALDAVSALADLRLTLLLADSASVSLLPTLQDGFYPPDVAPGSRHRLVLNQVDIRRRLNREITEFLQARYRDTLLAILHRDEAVPEAGARQISVFEHAESSRAARDLGMLCRRSLALLNGVESAVASPLWGHNR